MAAAPFQVGQFVMYSEARFDQSRAVGVVTRVDDQCLNRHDNPMISVEFRRGLGGGWSEMLVPTRPDLDAYRLHQQLGLPVINTGQDLCMRCNVHRTMSDDAMSCVQCYMDQSFFRDRSRSPRPAPPVAAPVDPTDGAAICFICQQVMWPMEEVSIRSRMEGA